MPPTEQRLEPLKTPRHTSFHWIILAIIVALAAIVRCWNLSTPGLWQDELYSLELANGWGLSDQHLPLDTPIDKIPDMTHLRDARSIGEVFKGLREDNHPPLYFLLLRAWEHLGESDASLRWLSILFSLAAIVLLERIVTEISGPKAGLIAAALMAINGPQIEFARELRNYMPLTTFALAAALPLIRMQTREISRSRVIVAALAVVAMCLTHYYAIAVVIALGLWAIISFKGRARGEPLAALIIGGSIFAVLWLRLLIVQLPHFGQNNQWLNDPSPDASLITFGLLWRIPQRLLLDPHSIQWLYNLESLSGLLWISLPFLWFANPAMRLWIIWIVACVGMVGVIDLAHHSHQLSMVRYSLAATPAACALIAIGAAGNTAQADRRRWIPAILAAVLMLRALPDALGPLWKIDWNLDSQIVAAQAQPGDAIVFMDNNPQSVQAGAMALSFSRKLGDAMPTPIVLLNARPSDATLAALASHRVWAIGNGDLIDQPLPGFIISARWPLPPPRPNVALEKIASN